MTNISFRATYAGHIDGERVAWTYRAYNEEGAPYVLALDTEVGVQTIVQAPTEFLDGIEAEDEDRENAIEWVHRLTELVDKARKYDVINDAVGGAAAWCDNFHDLHVVEESADDDDEGVTVTAQLWLPIPDDGVDEAFTVSELTDQETDSEWVDCDGDHCKHIDGRWYISYDGTSQWHTADWDELTDYGPYTVVRS